MENNKKKVTPEVSMQVKKLNLIVCILSVFLLALTILNLINSFQYKKLLYQQSKNIFTEKKILQKLQRY